MYFTDTQKNCKRENDFFSLRRFEQALRNLASRRNLDGNPFATSIPDVGTEHEQLTIAELSADLRRRIPRGHEDDAYRMIRATVLTRSKPDGEPVRVTTMESAARDYLDAHNGREPMRGRNHYPSPIDKNAAHKEPHPAILRATVAAIGERVKTRKAVRR